MDWSRGITIGQGSSATVSIGTCRQSYDVVAVKSTELSKSEMLQREQTFLCTLSSPFIVSYVGCDINRRGKRLDKLMYNLIMEYAPAGTLVHEIRWQGGRLDESKIGYYTHQIVRGLEYLHSCGVAHCDIKGSNVLLGERGAKIADFGCAKWMNRGDSASVAIGGTPMFMAPEVARGEEQNFPADIWALGCTIIEMASGMSPWPNINNDPLAILYKIVYSGELPNCPNNLSTQATDFLSKCLRIVPKERWTAKQLANHPFLEEFKSGVTHIQEHNTTSPTSILDQGVWSSFEDIKKLGDFVDLRSTDSPVGRIERLSLNSRLPDWTWEEGWNIIRGNKNEEICESGKVGGDDIEELESSSCSTVNREEDELILNLVGVNFCCRNRCSEILMGFKCTDSNASSHGLNLARHKAS